MSELSSSRFVNYYIICPKSDKTLIDVDLSHYRNDIDIEI